MTEGFESALEQCLSQLAAREATISSCLARYPDMASELEPMLLVAEDLWAIPKPELAPEARSRIEERLLGTLRAESQQRTARKTRVGLSLGWRVAAIGFSAVVMVLFFATILAPTVGDTLPGSPLHHVKLAAEDTWLWLAPRPHEPRLQISFARRRLDEVQALTARGSVGPSAVEAMMEATGAALDDVEALPPPVAVPLVDDLLGLLAEQKRILSELQSSDLARSRERVETALQANAEQKGRASILASSLPMPPVITISETVSPSYVPEPGGVVEFRVLVTNDGAEDVTLTSLTTGVRADPNELGTCTVSGDGIRLAPGEAYECAYSAFVFHNAGAGETDTVQAVAIDSEGNTAEVMAAATVTVADAAPAISVSKTAEPSSVNEPGGTVNYTVRVLNESAEAINLFSLVDDVHGDLDGRDSCGLSPEGRILDPGEFYACTYAVSVTGNAGESEAGMVTAVASDDEGNLARAAGVTTVTVADLAPQIAVSKTAVRSSVLEPGGVLQFMVSVRNNGAEEITLSSLEDGLRGDLLKQGSCTVSSPEVDLGPGETLECSFEAEVEGNAGDSKTTIVTVRAVDDEGNAITATDSAVIDFTDRLPVIAVSKTAARSKIPEPGGTVEYTVLVSNQTVETVTLTSLVDDLHGDLRGRGTCLAARSGVVLNPGTRYQCKFDTLLTGNAGDTESSSVTVLVIDDEGNQAEASAATPITVVDVLPRIEVSRSVSPEGLPEPGGSVRFGVSVANSGEEDLTLLSLLTHEIGDLDGRGTCRMPSSGILLGPRESYQCAFAADVSGNAGDSVTDTLVATVTDDEGNRVEAVAEISVGFSDLLPDVVVSGTADPKEVPEPGGVVKYAINISNEGTEAVALSFLQSNVHGDLNGQGTCSVPQTGLWLPAGDSYRCTYDADLVGETRAVLTNKIIVKAVDDEGNRSEISNGIAVAIGDLLPVVSVVATSDRDGVPESGGTVRFAIQVGNDGGEGFRLISLRDTLHGDLSGQGTCLVPGDGILLRPHSAYKCALSADVEGNGGDEIANVITAQGADDEGNVAENSSRATVRITDVQPVIGVAATATPTSVPESGGLVHFVMEVANLGIESVTLTSLVDDIHGDLLGLGTCTMPDGGISLGPGDKYECWFNAEVAGNAAQPQVDTLSAHASDDEGNQVVASDSVEVAVSDVPPLISVMNTSAPSVVSEPGGEVQYMLQIANQSGEAVRLTAILDDINGDLGDWGSCSIPAEGLVLLADEAYRCDFHAEVLGNAGETRAHTVTVQAVDDEGNRVEATDRATVTIADVRPTIALAAIVTPSSLPEPGGIAQVSLRVANEGAEPIALDSLFDDAQGDLIASGMCAPLASDTALAPGQVYDCSYNVQLSGDAGSLATNVVRVMASDDEDNLVEASATVSIAFSDVQPKIGLSMTALPAGLLERGGEAGFALELANVGMEAVRVISLMEVLRGSLNGQGTCNVPEGGIALDPGQEYECTFGVAVTESSEDGHTITVRATAIDNEGNSAEAVGAATIEF